MIISIMIWMTSEMNKYTLQFDYTFYASIYNCKEKIFFHVILPIWFGMGGSTLVVSLCVQEVSKILFVQGLKKKRVSYTAQSSLPILNKTSEAWRNWRWGRRGRRALRKFVCIIIFPSPIWEQKHLIKTKR